MSLATAGHDVEILGVWYTVTGTHHDILLLQQGVWNYCPVLDCHPRGWIGKVKNIWMRSQTSLARKLYKNKGIFTPELLGYGIRALLRAALDRRADLTIVHSEGGLWIGQRLRKAGLRVGVDFEDWFSEDMSQEAQIHRPLERLRAMEQEMLRCCRYSVTTSKVMAASMADRYDAPMPHVVYNAFPWSEREALDQRFKDRTPNRQKATLHWFSQTMGPGRGLELLFSALPHIRIPVEIHLRGESSASAGEWMRQQIPELWQSQVFVHPVVPNHELLSRISEHDIGLSLDDTTIMSRDLTVTNKFFQYVLAGLPVIATATRGQREVLDAFPDAGRLVPPGDARFLATTIHDFVKDAGRLAAHKKAALELARTRYCWEKQVPVVCTAVEEALQEKI
ncbi:MAG: glycosyltransferase [Magnetococcales bacterium]|nr:glycosyltransferase [Magnetococcales bacterium]